MYGNYIDYETEFLFKHPRNWNNLTMERLKWYAEHPGGRRWEGSQVETNQQSLAFLQRVLDYLWSRYGGTEASMVVAQHKRRAFAWE